MAKLVGTMTGLLREGVNSVGLDSMSTRLGIALLVVSGLFFAANFADKAWVSYQVAQEKQQYVSEIQSTQQQITSLQSQLKYMHSRAYYVQAARAFGFVQPGDIPVAIQAAPGTTPAAAPSPAATPVHRATQHQSWLQRVMKLIVPGL